MGWREHAACIGHDSDGWFDTYENSPDIRHGIDAICINCPVRQQCFGTGVSNHEWGVWAGVYLEDGVPSELMNNHKSQSDWTTLWEALTLEVEDVHG